MSASENLHRLESDLENQKADLRNDLRQAAEKARETRAALAPTNLVRERVYLLSALSATLGFILGYRGVSIEEIGKPAARQMLTSAGKQVGRRAIMGM